MMSYSPQPPPSRRTLLQRSRVCVLLSPAPQPDPAVFSGADKRVLNAKESEAYLALAFQGSSWTDEHAFPLMIMQTIMGGWDRSSGEQSDNVGSIDT